MVVRIVKDWSSPDIIYQQTPGGSGYWDGIKFTYEKIEECDFLLVFTRPHYDIEVKCPKGGKWLISGEPPTPAHRWHKKSYPYFDRIYSQHRRHSEKHIETHGALPWQIHKTYDELKVLKPGGGKKDRISAVVSELNWMSGHSKRIRFIEKAKDMEIEIDRFGRGVNPVDDKFDALYPYKYSLAIENSFYDHYWTDKIIDCFLCWTMPVYCGAKKITNYFPEESMLLINPDDVRGSVERIQQAIEENLWEKNLKAIQESRQLILDKYQLFPFISEEIKKYNLIGEEKIVHNIPRNPAPWDGNTEYKPDLLRKLEYKARKFFNLMPY